MASIKKKTIDKILLELNLTAEQVIEEAFFDNFKNKFTRKTPPATKYQLTNSIPSSINPTRQPKQKKSTPAAAAAPQPTATQQKPAGDLKATTVQTIDQLKGLANSLEQQAAAMPTINTQQASRLYQQLTSFLVDGIKKAQSAMVPGTAGVGPRAENLPQAPEGITQPDGTQLPSSIAPQTNPGLAPQTATSAQQATTIPTDPLAGYKLPAGLAVGPPPIPNLMTRVKEYADVNKKTDMTDADFGVLAKDLFTTPENLKTQYNQQLERNKTSVLATPNTAATPASTPAPAPTHISNLGSIINTYSTFIKKPVASFTDDDWKNAVKDFNNIDPVQAKNQYLSQNNPANKIVGSSAPLPPEPPTIPPQLRFHTKPAVIPAVIPDKTGLDLSRTPIGKKETNGPLAYLKGKLGMENKR